MKSRRSQARKENKEEAKTAEKSHKHQKQVESSPVPEKKHEQNEKRGFIDDEEEVDVPKKEETVIQTKSKKELKREQKVNQKKEEFVRPEIVERKVEESDWVEAKKGKNKPK
jgi:hypothetical protein